MPRSSAVRVAAQSAEVSEAAGTSEDAVAASRGEVVLAVLGQFPDDLVDAVEDALEAELQVRVRRIEPVPLPESAYYSPRKRYRADRLLDFLPSLIPEDAAPGTRILGLTHRDISTTNGKFEDWGIFGLGQMPGEAAVISAFRLKRGAKNRKHLRFRVATTAVHEIGHTFGLDHCDEDRCVMQDAEGGIENTDTSTGTLAPGCRAKLEAQSF